MASKVLTAEILNNYFKNAKNFENVLKKVKIISIGGGNCTAELKVEEEHTNPMGGLHGGFSSTLVDSISTFGFITHDKVQGAPSVSVDIHMTFLKGAKLGDEIIIDCKTIRAGRTLGFCEVEILNKKTKEVLVKGSHTKFIMSST